MHPMIRDGKSPPRPAPPTNDPFAWVERAPFFQAGLAGYSDAAMRLIARRHGCPYCITEAMLDYFLINGGKGLRHAELEDEDHPIAGQLMGSHPDEIAAGAKVLVKLGYDVIDINLACPVKKIKKKCRGGHLLSAPDEAVAIVKAVADAVGGVRPMSIKLRRGYDDSLEAEKNFHTILQAVIDNGFAAATIHGRTVAQKYDGPSRWPALKKIVATYKGSAGAAPPPNEPRAEALGHAHAMPQAATPPDSQTPGAQPAQGEAGNQALPLLVRRNASALRLLGSGDIFSPQAIFDMIRETGVDAVSVARGCIGDPWIFRQAHQLMRGEQSAEPTLCEQRAVLAEHFRLSVAIHGEKTAGRTMRKFGIKFSRHHPKADAVKDAFIRVQTIADWHAALDAHYPVESAEPLRAS